MEIANIFGGIYQGRKVLVTGHTGFKGSWLSLWLNLLGAEVIGYSLEMLSSPSHYELLHFNHASYYGDIADYQSLVEVMSKEKPEIVFHLAAQPLVRASYHDPKYTHRTNILGTANVIESCLNVDSVQSIVVITSDKCYQNKEWIWRYKEVDRLGGYDPYSVSKACAELITASYRDSFRHTDKQIATARAGNVIGGGDWAPDRIVPDLVRAASNGQCLMIRSPNSVRPWQHVLESLSGYLCLGQKLLNGQEEYAQAWNFGPEEESEISVLKLVEAMKKQWSAVSYSIQTEQANLHEASLLKLDNTKVKTRLGWKPVWNIETTIEKTINWYRSCYEKTQIVSETQISNYIENARQEGLDWAG